MLTEFLKKYRLDNGFSQKEMSEMLNMKQQQYSRIENGVNKTSFEKVLEILKTLKYKIEITKEG